MDVNVHTLGFGLNIFLFRQVAVALADAVTHVIPSGNLSERTDCPVAPPVSFTLSASPSYTPSPSTSAHPDHTGPQDSQTSSVTAPATPSGR